MSLDVETVLERRRLRRQVGLWRGLAILAGVLVLIAFASVQAVNTGIIGTNQIARVTIEGLITDDRKRLKLLEKISNTDHVRGVILYIDSPGGTTTGGEGLYNAIRALAEKKPVAAQFGTVAASAAYIAGLGTDHIVARGNTITGSVGVIVQWPEISGLLERLGVKVNEVKSGSLKSEPGLFTPAPAEAVAVTREMIEDGQAWFNGLVQDRREIDLASVPGLTEGRVYSGRMAVQYRLIDQIGAEAEAVNWMVETRDVPAGLKVVDWKPREDLPFPFGQGGSGAWSYVAWALGLPDQAPTQLGTLGLDGLLSVWQPGES